MNEVIAENEQTGKTIWELIERNLREIHILASSVARKFAPLTANEAEELTHAAIIRVYEKSERERLSFASDKYFLAWMKRVLKNVAREQLRKARDSHFPVELIPGTEKEPHEQVAERQSRDLLLSQISALREPYRVIIELSLEGLTSMEIADFLTLSDANVRQRLSRAREMLRESLAK